MTSCYDPFERDADVELHGLEHLIEAIATLATPRIDRLRQRRTEIERNRAEPRLANGAMEEAVDDARAGFAEDLRTLAEQILRKLALEPAGTVPLRMAEHPYARRDPGRVQALTFVNTIVESRAILLGMQHDEVSVVLAQAAAEGDALPMLSLDTAPAVLRDRVAKLLAAFPVHYIAAMRAALRTEIDPRGSWRRGVFVQVARRFLERATSAASDIGQHDPRVRDGHMKPDDFIRPIIDPILAAIA